MFLVIALALSLMILNTEQYAGTDDVVPAWKPIEVPKLPNDVIPAWKPVEVSGTDIPPAPMGRYVHSLATSYPYPEDLLPPLILRKEN